MEPGRWREQVGGDKMGLRARGESLQVSWVKSSENRPTGPLPKSLVPQKQNNQPLTLGGVQGTPPPARVRGSEFSPGQEAFARVGADVGSCGEVRRTPQGSGPPALPLTP